MLYGQWQKEQFILTYLEDYKTQGEAAMPYVHITPHLDYKLSKNIVLVHGEFLPYLNKQVYIFSPFSEVHFS